MNSELQLQLFSIWQNKGFSVTDLRVAAMVSCGIIAISTAIYFWRNYGPEYWMLKFASQETLKHACESLRIEKEKYNIALVGRGLTGRTTLIKAITGQEAKLENLEYGTKYETPRFQDCSFWEMPKFFDGNANQYFNYHFLFHFDLIVVVCQGTLSEDEIKLLSEAKKRSIDVILVRSRCDEDFESQKSFEKVSDTTQGTADIFINNLETHFKNDLAQVNLNFIPVFFISAVILCEIQEGHRQSYTFQENLFLDELKQKAALKSQTAHSHE